MIDLKTLQDSDNLNELLTDEESSKIGLQVKQAYTADKTSRLRFETMMENAEDLALQVMETKTYPWEGAANVKFPLLTIAAMQFHARAMPALVKVPDLVKFRVQGADPDGKKASRAGRISRHMSYQFLEEDEPWEEQHDRMLLALPILGCAFKKSYYDKTKGHNCSTLVLPKNLVVHYYAKTIEDCERKTEVLELSPRVIKERQLRNLFSDFDLPPAPTPTLSESDRRAGLSPPADDRDRSRVLLEQHCYLDLDEDGYKEPYVVTIDESSGKVFRIVSRWDNVTTEQSIKINELMKRIKAYAEGLAPPQNAPTPEELDNLKRAEQIILDMQRQVEELHKETPKVLKIDAVEYYTKYDFIPSPDGSFYGLGFGALLGPINDSVNTLINQLLDAGHMSSGAVGFIGKGARIPGGNVRFRPYEFQKLPSTGGAIRDAIVQLNIATPSPVLFQLLGLFISYAERIGSVTDTMVGENPGQNTPAYNMSAMLEQGMQVFNAIFKRIYRSMRSEFRKHYKLNSLYLDQESYFSYQDSDSKILRTDYTGDTKDLIPAADPNAFSSKEKSQKSMMISERAQMIPGYDPIAVEKRWLSSMEVSDSDELYPLKPSVDEQGQPTGGMELVYPPQPNPEFEIKRADLQRKTLEGQSRHDIQVKQVEIESMLAEAKVMELIGKAQKEKDDTLAKKLDLQLRDMISKREAMTAIAVAEIGRRDDKQGKVD